MATIEIDGKKFEVENGKMIIEVADDAGIPIPRFCYHKKLSIAANCRMCLVQIENSKKTVPACATPITDGMKVFTQSEDAIRSQKAVMEFLLINHPLDCPICDQGGECELQDVSMGYGQSTSEYHDTKRAVEDDNLGPLIATEMTRCIHCTRCVRFGDEIAGVRELGATYRGEKTEIGTYVQHAMTSEVSGNIIDLCPVGALTSKPYRFTARPWEMTQYPGVAPHDCLGSNVYFHVRRNQLMRVVPRDNDAINESWLSDRDRFSYVGLNSASRALKPKIKKDGQWHEVDWQTALQCAADGISKLIKTHGSSQFAAFCSPSATVEEMYLLQKWMRRLGVNNLDHRLHQSDFRDQAHMPLMPVNKTAYADIEHLQAIVLLGCHIHREVPLAGLKVRKAMRNGAVISAINPVDYDYPFEVQHSVIESPHEMVAQLAQLVLALIDNHQELDAECQRLLIGLKPSQTIEAIAQTLKREKAAIITGALVENHPDASLIRSLLYILEQKAGITVFQLTTGSNAAGAWLSGMIPHRSVAGKTVDSPGLNIQQSLEEKLKGYCLFGVEPAFDFANPSLARQSMLAAEFVVMITSHYHESMLDYANVILPYAPYAETSGTYINIDGLWQTVTGALQPPGEARPGWKIIRVLANLLGCDDFKYTATEDVLAEVKRYASTAPVMAYHPIYGDALPMSSDLHRVGEWPLYRADALVRSACPLQDSSINEEACVRMHPKTAALHDLAAVDNVTVSQGKIKITLPLKKDPRIAMDVVYVDNALPETIDLGPSFGAIQIKS